MIEKGRIRRYRLLSTLAGGLAVSVSAVPALSQDIPTITLDQMIVPGPASLAWRLLLEGYVPAGPNDLRLADAITALDGQAVKDLDRKALAALYALRAEARPSNDADAAEADFDRAIAQIDGRTDLSPDRDELILRKAHYLASLGGPGTDKALRLYHNLLAAFDPARLSTYPLASPQETAIKTYASTAMAVIELSFSRGKPDEARQSVEEVLAKIGRQPSPVAQERVLAVLYTFGAGLAALSASDQEAALQVFDQVLKRGATALSGERYQWIAQSLTAKGLLLRTLGRLADATAVESDLLDRFADDSDLRVARAVLMTRLAQTDAQKLPPKDLAAVYGSLAEEYAPKLQQGPSLVNTPPGPLAAMIVQTRLRQAAALGRVAPPPMIEIIQAVKAAVILTEPPAHQIPIPMKAATRLVLARAYMASGPLAAAPALAELDTIATLLAKTTSPALDVLKLTEMALRVELIAAFLPDQQERLPAIRAEARRRFGANPSPQVREMLNHLERAASP